MNICTYVSIVYIYINGFGDGHGYKYIRFFNGLVPQIW